MNGPSGPGPLAELHVHLEATASPALIRRLAKRHGMATPPGTLDGDRYVWRDFLDFLEVFDRAVTVIRTAEDYRDVTLEYLTACAGEGAIYVEVTISPDHAAAAGIPYPDLLDGVAAGIDEARTETGVESRVIVTAVRNFGTERAEAVAAVAAAAPHPYVTGFGLAGDEAGFPPAPFARAFEIAHDAGLGITCHAGEWAGPSPSAARSRSPCRSRALGTASGRSRTQRWWRSWPSAAPCSRSARPRTSSWRVSQPRRAPVRRAPRRRRPRHARLRRPARRGTEPDRRGVRCRARHLGLGRRRSPRDHADRGRGRVRRRGDQKVRS